MGARGAGPWTYVAEGAHTHEVSLSVEQLEAVSAARQ